MKPISALIALALIVGVPLLAWMILASWAARKQKPEIVEFDSVKFRTYFWDGVTKREIF